MISYAVRTPSKSLQLTTSRVPLADMVKNEVAEQRIMAAFVDLGSVGEGHTHPGIRKDPATNTSNASP